MARGCVNEHISLLYWIPKRDDHSQEKKVITQNSAGQGLPEAQTRQHPLPTANLWASASFSVFSIDISWTMCELTCLLSDLDMSKIKQMQLLQIMHKEVVLLLQTAGNAQHVGLQAKQSSAPHVPRWVNHRAEPVEHTGCLNSVHPSDGNKVQKQVILCCYLNI